MNGIPREEERLVGGHFRGVNFGVRKVAGAWPITLPLEPRIQGPAAGAAVAGRSARPTRALSGYLRRIAALRLPMA